MPGMKPATLRAPRRVAALLLLFAVARAAAETNEPPHLQRMRHEIAQAEAALRDATNAAERAVWERRAELARRALDNGTRLLALQAREKAFRSGDRARADAQLRQALQDIEEQTAGDAGFTQLSASLTAAREARRDFAARPEEPEHAARPTLRDARLAALDARVNALALQRDNDLLRSRLVEEAERTRARPAPSEAPSRVTIAGMLKLREAASRAAAAAHEYAQLRASSLDRLATVRTAIDISTNYIAQTDEEAAILRDRIDALRRESRGASRSSGGGRLFSRLFGSSSRDEQELKSLLALAQRENESLEARVVELEAQCAAIDAHLRLVDLGAALHASEEAVLRARLHDQLGAYRRQTLAPLALAVGVVLLYFLLSRLVVPLLARGESLFVARRLGGYLTALVVVMILAVSLLEDLKAIATVLGIVGAAVVIALQDFCSAFAGWFGIVTSRKVRIGDRVEIDGRRGDVIDIQMLRTTLLELDGWLGVDEPTGRVLIVPNSFIFKSHVFNYGHVHPFVSHRIDITVTFETPVEKARELLARVLEEEAGETYRESQEGDRRMQHHYGTGSTLHPPHMHTTIADSGICFSLYYVSHYRKNQAMRDRLMNRIAREFEGQTALAFAYPTQRHIPTPEGPGLPVRVVPPAGR